MFKFEIKQGEVESFVNQTKQKWDSFVITEIPDCIFRPKSGEAKVELLGKEQEPMCSSVGEEVLYWKVTENAKNQKDRLLSKQETGDKQELQKKLQDVLKTKD